MEGLVEEYMSDELASGSEDEKRLKRAKEAASRKKRHTAQACRDSEKRLKSVLAPNDQQLFRGKNFDLCSLLSSHWVLCFFLTDGSACEAYQILYLTVFCLLASGNETRSMLIPVVNCNNVPIVNRNNLLS